MRQIRLLSKAQFATAAKTYSLVIASVIVSAIFRYSLNPHFGRRVAFITYFPALVFSAWVGGWSGGLFALILTIFAATFVFISPTHAIFVAKDSDIVTLLIFVVVGLSISAISNEQRKAHQQAQKAADEAQASEAALRQSEARYRYLLETANEGIITIGVDDQINFANARMAEMLGYPLDQLIGMSVLDFVFPDDLDQAKERRELRRAGHSEEYETRLRHQDGSEVWTVANVTAQMENGVYIGTFSLFTDITERKQSEQALSARAEREAVINQIGQSIRASLDPWVIQSTVASQLGEALKANRCFYVTSDWSQDALIIGRDWYSANVKPMINVIQHADLPTALSDLFENGTAVIQDSKNDTISAASALLFKNLGQRAMIAVPFFHESALVAALFVATTQARVWTKDEIALVEQIATLTRTALETARVSQRESTIAQQLQKALQPTVPHQAPGLELADYYRPALEEAGVGGDFSDVFLDGPNVSFLVVGDLSGKGLAAASQVATVRNMLRYALYNETGLAAPLTRLNRTLVDKSLMNGFATLFVARYDAQSQELSYVNCGQESGLLRRSATGEVEYLQATGPVLGAQTEAEFTENCVPFEKGDALAIFTDGLTEAGPTRTSLLEIEGVATILRDTQENPSAAQLAQHLISIIDDYARGGVRDDVCLLVAVAAT